MPDKAKSFPYQQPVRAIEAKYYTNEVITLLLLANQNRIRVKVAKCEYFYEIYAAQPKSKFDHPVSRAVSMRIGFEQHEEVKFDLMAESIKKLIFRLLPKT